MPVFWYSISMKLLSPLVFHKTSVSLRVGSIRRTRAARLILSRNGIILSEQEILRRLLKLYLKHWRGKRRKSDSARRYNHSTAEFAIRPLYIDQVLYSAVWERAIHSGESVSRMLDFAIRTYLPRLMESLLSSSQRIGQTRTYNAAYWRQRLSARKTHYPDFFINYRCHTRENTDQVLEYIQKTEIIPKTGLSPWEILDLMQIAS